MADTGKEVSGVRQAPRSRDDPAPAAGAPRSSAAGALSMASVEPLSMDKVGRFFDGVVEPQGNALVGEMVDENGPLAGRESARPARRTGSLAGQFADDGRSLLFAPNDAPDEMPDQSTELGRLLREQEFRQRRRFGA